MKYKIPSLDYHIIDACNLSCQFCSHYSNFRQPVNKRSITDAAKEWSEWSSIVEPKEFVLLGGEPTLHPDLCQLIEEAARVWFDSTVLLITNGACLDKHPSLPDALISVNGTMTISEHYSCDRQWELRVRETIAPWIARGLRVKLWNGKWCRGYNLTNGRPTPFDGDIELSFNSCPAKDCKMLRDGKIWKCPQVALHKQAGIDWTHFVGYKPLVIGGDYESFFSARGELCCTHCPTSTMHINKPDPRTPKLPVLQPERIG